MEKHTEVFVGVDVAKARHAVAVAEEGRQGEVRYIGEIGADVESVRRLVGKLEKRHGRLHFCYEAGPTGYGLYRQLTTLGHRCTVVAPSLIPRVTLPKMWRKVLVRAFAAVFYETDPDGRSQYCRKLCDYPRALVSRCQKCG